MISSPPWATVVIYYNLRSFNHAYSDTGWFEVEHVVINTFDCPDTSTAMIRINPETLIFVPNAFTPDGDGTNESFQTYRGWRIKSFELRIFQSVGVRKSSSPMIRTYRLGRNRTRTELFSGPFGTYSWKVFSKTQNDDLIDQ